MGKRLKKLTPRLISFINAQPLFFVATAMEEGRINLSPKGMASFKIIDENRAVWLNLTGSGNETSTHLQFSDRMTIMFCAFEGPPMILRLYGTAVGYHERDDFWNEHIHLFPDMVGSRQLINMQIDLVQTSCGTGVPLMDYKEDRSMLKEWAVAKGDEGIKDYWKQKNTISLDGHPTGIFE